MFWSDPSLYGVNMRDLPGQMPMNVWHNVPKFIPNPYGFVPPYYIPQLTTPFVPQQLTPFIPQQLTPFMPQHLTPFVRPEFTQFPRPEAFTPFTRPELMPQLAPQIPFNPYVNIYGWQRPFGF